MSCFSVPVKSLAQCISRMGVQVGHTLWSNSPAWWTWCWVAQPHLGFIFSYTIMEFLWASWDKDLFLIHEVSSSIFLHSFEIYSVCTYVCWSVYVYMWRPEEDTFLYRSPSETVSLTDSGTHHMLGRLVASNTQGSSYLLFLSFHTDWVVDITGCPGFPGFETNSSWLFSKHCYPQRTSPASWSSFFPLSFHLRLMLTERREFSLEFSKTWYVSDSFPLLRCWSSSFIPLWSFGG